MKIANRKNVTKTFEAAYKEPLPVLNDKVMVGDKVCDITVVQSEINLQIDGEMYTGYHCYILKKSEES